MIYYDDKLIDLSNPKNEVEKEVVEQVKAVKAKYFGEKSKGYAMLLYPNGRRVMNESGWLENAKVFPVFTVSSDALYRVSNVKQSKDKDGVFRYDRGFELIIDGTRLNADKLELIWFLTYKSEDIANKTLAFEDTAAIAKEKVQQFAFDTELKFYLFGSRSPLIKDANLMIEIAKAVGIVDTHKMTDDEIRIELYDRVVAGEKRKDKSCNFNLFLELTESADKLELSTLARRLLASKELYYDSNEYSWFLQGSDTPFLKVKGTDVNIKEQLLLDACMNSTLQIQMLGKFTGKGSELTAETILAMKRPELQSTCKLQGIPNKPTEGNEVLQQKLLDHFNLER